MQGIHAAERMPLKVDRDVLNIKQPNYVLGSGEIIKYYSLMYSVHCTLYSVHCTLYSVHCTVYNVQCTLYNGRD